MNAVRHIDIREYERSETYIKDRPRQGEIWTVELSGNGYKMKKTRPCIIAQRDELNDKLQTTLVIPITGSKTEGESGVILPGEVIHDCDMLLSEDLIEYFRFPKGVHGTAIITQGTTVDMNDSLGKFIGKLNQKGIDILREKMNLRY